MENFKFTLFSLIILALFGFVGYWAVTTIQSGPEYVASETTRQLQKEVAAEVAPQFVEQTPIESMSLAEIDSEIGERLRAKLRQEDDEMVLMLILASMH